MIGMVLSAFTGGAWGCRGRVKVAEETGQGGQFAARVTAVFDIAFNKRYVKKLPAKAEQVDIETLPGGGIRMDAKVPASNIPGSHAEYVQIMDKDENAVLYLKNTYAPDGSIVHFKLK